MSEAVIPVRMSDPVLHAASAQAHRSGQSIEDWLLTVAVDRIREEEASERFFRRAAERSPEDNRNALLAILNSVPDLPPMPGDELPEGWTPRERSTR